MTAQKKASTSFNRSPGIFRAAQTWSNTFSSTSPGAPLRILSFGCSDGSEMATLRCYFPYSSIFGCDVTSVPFEKAPQGKRVPAVLYKRCRGDSVTWSP